MANDMAHNAISVVKRSRKLRGLRKQQSKKNRTFWTCSAPGCVQIIAFDQGCGTVCSKCSWFEKEFTPEFLKPIGEDIKKLRDIWVQLKARNCMPIQKEQKIIREFNYLVKEILSEYGFINELMDDRSEMESAESESDNNEEDPSAPQTAIQESIDVSSLHPTVSQIVQEFEKRNISKDQNPDYGSPLSDEMESDDKYLEELDGMDDDLLEDFDEGEMDDTIPDAHNGENA